MFKLKLSKNTIQLMAGLLFGFLFVLQLGLLWKWGADNVGLIDITPCVGTHDLTEERFHECTNNKYRGD